MNLNLIAGSICFGFFLILLYWTAVYQVLILYRGRRRDAILLLLLFLTLAYFLGRGLIATLPISFS